MASISLVDDSSIFVGFLGGLDVKESAHNGKDMGWIPGVGRSPGGGNDNPLQYSGASRGQRSLLGYSPWVAKSQTQLSN